MDVSEKSRVSLGLVLRYLRDSGCTEAYAALCKDADTTLSQVNLMSDVSLPQILTKYVELFEEKHGQKPQFLEEMYSYPSTATESIWVETRPRSSEPKAIIPTVLRKDPEIAGTRMLGTMKTVKQEEFFHVLAERGVTDPGEVFRIAMPLACARRFRPSQLILTSLQENVLYGLVGCEDIMWRGTAVSQDSRDILAEQYGISKRTLQLFFKNRYPSNKVKKRKYMESPHTVREMEQYRSRNGFIPISPATTSTTTPHVSSFLDLVRELDPEGVPVSPSIASQQQHNATDSRSMSIVKSSPPDSI